MSADGKTTFYDSLVKRAKNIRFVALGLFFIAIATGGITVFLQLVGGYEKLIYLFGSKVVLASINVLPPDKAAFGDGQGIPCLQQDKIMRVFEPRSEHVPNSPLQLAFTFQNRAASDAIFTSADFVVSQTQQTAGGGPGTVEPNHAYKMNLAFRTGKQPLVLNPPYRIPANDTGAFEIDLTPAADGIGLCWVLYIEFHTNLGRVRTEPFAVTMSKSPR